MLDSFVVHGACYFPRCGSSILYELERSPQNVLFNNCPACRRIFVTKTIRDLCSGPPFCRIGRQTSEVYSHAVLQNVQQKEESDVRFLDFHAAVFWHFGILAISEDTPRQALGNKVTPTCLPVKQQRCSHRHSTAPSLAQRLRSLCKTVIIVRGNIMGLEMNVGIKASERRRNCRPVSVTC